jgi:hypothetical protein
VCIRTYNVKTKEALLVSRCKPKASECVSHSKAMLRLIFCKVGDISENVSIPRLCATEVIN